MKTLLPICAIWDKPAAFLFHRKELVDLKWKGMDFPMKQQILNPS